MIQRALLRTKGMFDHCEGEEGYELWKEIAEYMDGEEAIVGKRKYILGKYVLLGLKNGEKNKELLYKIEQDRTYGCFINDRAGFEEAWESGEYELEGGIILEKENVKILEED